MGVRAIVQFPDGVVVGDHKPIKTPLISQNIPQQPPAGVRRNPVDLIVGGHHTDDPRLIDRILEGLQKDLPKYPLRDVCRGTVHAPLRFPMPCKLLQGGTYPFPVSELFTSLKSFHCGSSHLTDKPVIFTNGLLVPPPSRVSRHIHDGVKGMVASTETGFPGDDRVDLFYQAGMKGPGQGNRLWKTGGTVR